MSGAELGLAVLATTDLCFKYCKILIEKYGARTGAESEVNQRVLRIKGNWMKTAMQLEILASVRETMNDQHQRVQDEILEVLLEMLNSAHTRIEGLQSKKSRKSDGSEATVKFVRKWKYALTKECLDKAIQDMEDWQRLFDPSWIFVMSLPSSHIDQQLARYDQVATGPERVAQKLRASLKTEILDKVFLPEDEFIAAARGAIPFSSAQTMKRLGSEKWLIVDSATVDGDTDLQMVTKDVRALARRLSQVKDLSCGLLNCRGVVKIKDTPNKRIAAFNFIFKGPDGLRSPRSLRDILICAPNNVSLSDRLKIAQQLDSRFDGAFLLGFEKFRLADGKTMRLGDSEWGKDLYRHPDRQGLQPAQDYIMQHDIYSLGVCLLEVGLWRSLVSYGEEGGSPYPSDTLALLLDQYKYDLKTAASRKSFLIDLATQQLPSHMGDKYTETVLTCLTCLDNDNTDFGDRAEFEDEDGVLVGVRYIEKVLLRLNSVSM